MATVRKRSRIKTLKKPLKAPEISFDDVLLTPEQTATRLGVTPGTLAVWRCTERHCLPYTYCGRLVMYYKRTWRIS